MNPSEDTGDNPLYVDLVEIVESAPSRPHENGVDSAVLRAFLNAFNNHLYVLVKNSGDALKLIASGQSANEQVRQISVAGDQLTQAARRLQDLVEGPPGFRGAATVLIADDEPVVRALLKASLQNDGYIVLEACSGQQALEVFTSYPGRIHLVLADVSMAPTDGYDLVRKVLMAKPETKAIYMSGNYPDHTRAMPGTEFLFKPDDLAKGLSQRIRQILSRP